MLLIMIKPLKAFLIDFMVSLSDRDVNFFQND